MRYFNAHRTLVGRALVDRCGVVVGGQFGIPRIHKEKSVGVVRVLPLKSSKPLTQPVPTTFWARPPGWEASILMVVRIHQPSQLQLLEIAHASALSLCLGLAQGRKQHAGQVAMMAITTNSSIKVNPFVSGFFTMGTFGIGRDQWLQADPMKVVGRIQPVLGAQL